MYPSTSFQKNLRIPETTLNLSLNIFFKHLNLINILKPQNFSTSCNLSLINKLDSCEETRGKISFLPLEFLIDTIQKYYKYEPLNIEYIKQINKLELKTYYLSLLIDKGIFNSNFYENEKFKGVPIKYFRKHLLQANLSKAMDACRIIDNNSDILDNIIDSNIKTYNQHELIEYPNRNEWLSKKEICNIIQSKLLSLDDNLINLIEFKFLFLNKFYDENYTYSYLQNTNNFKCEENKRFLCFFILYNSHFTAVIIDKKVKIKPNNKKTDSKFAFFFNSCGYNPNNFKLNNNYWFIDNSSKILRHDKCITNNENNYSENMPIKVLTKIFFKEFGVTNFVFNTYSIQNLGSECGTFSTLFLYFFLDYIGKRGSLNIEKELIPDVSKIDIYKFLYFNMINIGNDLTYSYFRGLLFFSNEDLKNNNLSISEYLNSPFVYNISNSKFSKYKDLYIKSLENIEKITKKIKKEYQIIKNIELINNI